ncbi:LysR family transcriptional regulator [Starkeya sp. ORNL1]|uniref:LysR family transcriptional regulator n=1 Tax=Starkeya sp. ORNL1 TaxID=2709380 RepID=UPI001463BF1B|nr:LysR family transcriptional regulator [Starkeya sp. ORNL1]QJP12781.1 LysR family transcriptional regulator [Starkeya sp. ORNL1]
MFELSHLRCFVAVAEELHFGRAAARLNLTQPPLSRQIQLLEHTLDVRLLDRTSRSVALTRAGHNFLPEARRLLRLAEGAALAARRTASGEEGSITLGFTAASGYEFLPRLIKTFRTEAPGIDLVLKEMVSADQLDSLTAGRIDVGLVRPSFNRRELASLCVVREPLLLAAPEDHPLATAPEVSVADLDRQPIVTFSPYEARYFYDLLATIFANAGITPHYAQHISQVHSIMGLVKAGIGLALVPRAALNLGFEGVVLRPIAIDARTIVELYAVWRPSNTNPAVATLQKTLRELAETSPPHAGPLGHRSVASGDFTG